MPFGMDGANDAFVRECGDAATVVLSDRTAALELYSILDTPKEPQFDDIARLASQVLNSPIAVVNLIASERQWFKAEVGIGARELPLSVSICVHALLEEDMLIIRDTRLDPRVNENPLITAENGLRFYAGALLKTPEGVAIGTLCVLDHQPRPQGITELQRLTLEVLARQVMAQLELRRALNVQRDAAGKLAASEARTRLALEAGGMGIWQGSPNLREMSWDGRTRELLGHTPDEPLDYESFFSRAHPEDRERIRAINAAAWAPGGSGTTHMEYRTISAIDGRQRWVEAKGALVHSLDGVPTFVGTVRDITADKDAEHHRHLITAELQHRIKNTLAVVQSIVNQSLRKAATPQEARDAITERLITLGSAHDLLVQTSWTAAPIEAIVDGATQYRGASLDRISVTGPSLLLSARAALALSMSLHELTTNAVKYGALSVSEGRVEIAWLISESKKGPMFRLRWQEFDGPIVVPPAKKGFGTRLLDALAQDLCGEAALDYAPDGVVWTLHALVNDINP